MIPVFYLLGFWDRSCHFFPDCFDSPSLLGSQDGGLDECDEAIVLSNLRRQHYPFPSVYVCYVCMCDEVICVSAGTCVPYCVCEGVCI